MSKITKVIIRVMVNYSQSFVDSNKERVVEVKLLDGEEHIISDFPELTGLGLEPEALLGMTLEEATDIIEKLICAVEIRTTLREKGIIDYIANVSPFTDAGKDAKL